MAPARRQNYARSRSRSYIAPSYPPAAPPQPPPLNQDLMPPSSRYLHNLRVIQRHDPSIVSLFDQFPHVCVYHHKGDEWKKKGCEGAMFLFEREEEPKYGFYILNRNNTGDYIQRMTPDDDVEFASAYLIYRAFGRVTSDTIGLWTMVTQDREAMSQVMMRLHSYIKRNTRYPDEFRRRPDTWSTTPAPAHAQAILPPLPSQSAQSDDPSSMSALSALLAKLGGPPESPPTPSPPSRAVSASVPPPATGIPLLDSIFASASENATPAASSPGGNVFQALFANGVVTAANGSEFSSPSTSCGPTPTQHVSQLPTSSSPSRAVRSLVNGGPSAPAGRSVFPYPHPHPRRQSGRETVPPYEAPEPAWEHAKGVKSNDKGVGTLNGQKNSDRHLAVTEQPREDDEEAWEEEAGASVSVDASERGGEPRPSSRRNRARKAKKRERERERRRTLKRETAQAQDTGVGGDGGGVASVKGVEEEVEWPLVDDRSLSMDGDEDESVGLGDGLLSALAAVSEAELPPGQASGPPAPSKRAKNKERGKDRWKRKQKEEGLAQRPDDADLGAQGAASDLTSHPVQLRNAVLDAYGQRRRVGDGVLGEEALAKEVVGLIHNDPSFVRELYQQYLQRVQV